MADVFLSYKREDAPKVRKLVGALRATGLDVWWDEDIPGGAQWEATIEKSLAVAKAVVVCWSPASVESENVRSEARVAREDGRLIQAFLKPCTPPLFFGERQGIDLSKWRGNADDPRIAKLAENISRVAAGERVDGDERPRVRRWLEYRIHAAVATLLLLIGSFAGWWLLSPAKAQGPMTIAVLPFRALNPADANLVDAIWDDTRGAIGRNPNLRVIGRNALESLADMHLDPAGYRRKIGADYLLNGSVEHVGDQVRMKLSLVRTKDAAEVWSDQVGGKLDDVFAFQQRIANEVEGRIRGRVAPGGGVKAQTIATTGEVYAIYADARAQMRKRDPAGFHAAVVLLRRAIAIDPNYAPAWAALGQTWGMPGARDPNLTSTAQREQAVEYLEHALQLAPNLSQAHAALGMLKGPQGERYLRRALALDPGNVEAWGWLGNYFKSVNKFPDALAAYTRAEEMEPLWSFTVGNRILCLAQMRDMDGVNAEYRRLGAAGESVVLAKAKAGVASALGFPGDSIRIALELRKAHPEEASYIDTRIPGDLFQLGYIEQAAVAWNWPPDIIRDYRDDPTPESILKKELAGQPFEFWTDDTPAVFGRTLPRHGRLKEYVGYYRAAFKNTDDLFAKLGKGRLILITPSLVANLRAAGMEGEANVILQRVEPMLTPPLLPPDLADLARYRAVDGHDDEAISLLKRAVAGGWLPDGQFAGTDISQEPYFVHLVNRPDFQAVRQRIFARIAEERRKVPPQLLAQAYPTGGSRRAA
jgi:TolB-like protein/tetratricopeptide (TPR) repeat protein